MRGGAARACADLEDAQRPAVGDFADGLSHRGRDGVVVIGERWRVLIELLEREERPAGSDHGKRIALAAQNRRERASGAAQQHELGMKRGKALEQRSPEQLALGRLGEAAYAPAITRAGENPVVGEKPEEAIEQRPMCGSDAEAPGERFGAQRAPGAGLPAELAQCGDDVAPTEAVELALDRQKACARPAPSLPLREHLVRAAGSARRRTEEVSREHGSRGAGKRLGLPPRLVEPALGVLRDRRAQSLAAKALDLDQ